MKKIFEGKHGPLLIAEIGGNHEGNFEYAVKLTELAIKSGVDFVKFQIYTGDTLVSEIESPDRNKHFKKFELTNEEHLKLAQMVKNAGIGYTSSVWDLNAMSWIDPFIDIYKIGSGDLTAFSVLKETANRNKPIILSTGLSDEAEVEKAVAFIQNVNTMYRNKDLLAVLQCTSMYPIKNSDANLSVMQSFKSKFNLTIGYSDHTEGSKALFYAVAMGAEVLEFHFTDSREGKVFRDHKVSLTAVEVKELIDEIKEISELKGDAVKRPSLIEIENGHIESFRRAVYPSRDIQPGEVLDESNLTVLRPCRGIGAEYFYDILGRRAKVTLKRHHSIFMDLLD